MFQEGAEKPGYRASFPSLLNKVPHMVSSLNDTFDYSLQQSECVSQDMSKVVGCPSQEAPGRVCTLASQPLDPASHE